MQVFTMVGKHGECKVFSEIIDDESLKQIQSILNHPIAKNAHIRIMPDVHAGAGCVIGFTAKKTDIIIPNLIGVDIGCGVVSAVFNPIPISFSDLDRFIQANIPSSFDIHDTPILIDSEFKDEIVKVSTEIKSKEYSEYVLRSIGTLGGGNHFIEIEKSNKYLYLTVHTGSRNFGKEIAKYHQNIANKTRQTSAKAELKSKIEVIKQKFKGKDIEREINKLKLEEKHNKVPVSQAFLEGEFAQKYLEHMQLAQKFASLNRSIIVNKIMAYLKLRPIKIIESVHNYINFNDNIVRKGSISAHKGEEVVIPLNMKDGIIVGIGKGNPDWNFSAPHGAGRKLSRRSAKEQISIDMFKKSMEHIWSSSINENTLDEAPQAYKDPSQILTYLRQTIEIIDQAHPIYVYKDN